MVSSPTDSLPDLPQHAGGRPPAHQHHVRVGGVNEHYIVPELTGIKRFSRKARKLTHDPLQQYQGWEPAGTRQPYHEYVHQLVLAGWDNLQELDSYMMTDVEDQDLVVSVLDITESFEQVRRPDIHDGAVLKSFLEEDNRHGVKVRLYMAEQRGNLAARVIEAFGSSLCLDPRFFLWSMRDKHGVAPLPTSHRHRAPFMSIGFGVPLIRTSLRTDAENFRVSVYIHHDEVGSGWTGPKSFRQLYLESFEDLDLDQATASPFYAVHYLLRLNCYCWNLVVNCIRDEDRRINGISDTSVTHVEEIKKSLSVVKRGGSLGWRGRDDGRARESREALEEDFQHLVEQTDLLWQAR
ncbi:hypothetical protein GP486_007149, partial [Trichoglossum hirsutum]